MQTTREGNEDASAATSQPGMPAQREEDSGLHDIRSLASSQRMRIKRTSQNPILADDDVLASSSAGWKAVALPEPAKVVSLPELRESQKKLEFAAPRPIEQQQQQTEPVRTKKKSGGKGVIAVVGLGLAAAAGVTLFVMNNEDASEHAKSAPAAAAGSAASIANARAEQVAQAPAPAPAPAPAATPTVPSVPAIATDNAPQPAAEVAKVDTSVAAAAPAPAKVAVMGQASKKTKSKPEEKPVAPATVSKAESKAGKKAPEPGPAGGAGKGTGGEPATGGLDDLLKEAGVQQKQSPTDKPRPDKKSLDGSDIRAAMSAVQGKAQACYAGQQGTANVKLSVAPNGKVQKVTVTGVFAGTPVAACVAAAVKNATFPPWDGGPQSVSYSYLLSE